jgi:hypothetical protein
MIQLIVDWIEPFEGSGNSALGVMMYSITLEPISLALAGAPNKSAEFLRQELLPCELLDGARLFNSWGILDEAGSRGT